MVAEMELDALVVLGCRVGRGGELSGAALRRVERAARAYHEHIAPIVIVSGGKRWHDRAEAEAFCDALVARGVPRACVETELESRNTRENAQFSAGVCRARGFTRLGLVTCDWHMPRALAAFARHGFDPLPLGATAPAGVQHARRLRERAQLVLDRLLVAVARSRGVWLPLLCAIALVACRADPPAQRSQPRIAPSATPSASELRALRLAEYRREPANIGDRALAAPTPALREAGARALARSGVGAVSERLIPLLADEAPRVVAFAAFGLGRNGSERDASSITRALTARTASLIANTRARDADYELALGAIAQAIARSGGDEAERTLRAWLKLDAPMAGAAALGLGELGVRRGRLDDASFIAVLELASRGGPAADAATSVFARIAPPAGALRDRAVAHAEKVLANPAEPHAFAIRALSRAGAADSLLRVAQEPSLSPSDAAEIARESARLAEPGQAVLTALLQRFVPSEDSDALHVPAHGPELSTLLYALESLSAANSAAKPLLTRLAALPLPDGDAVARRHVAALRCAAARWLVHDALAPALAACDADPGSQSVKLAQVFVLDRATLDGPRAERFRALAADATPSVRIAALRALAGHRELRDTPRIVASALSSTAPGVVAAAAEFLTLHPQRAALAERGATTSPTDARVGTALTAALRAAPETNVALRTALIDAAGALAALAAMQPIEASCASGNASLRAHAERALHALGRPSARCAAPARAAAEPEELAHLLSSPVRLIFDTDAGELALRLDPTEAPLAVTRVVELARAGFYDGTLVHRATPGFLVQFGDPGGDGYGAAPRPPLPSELGPIPFATGSVGMAQAGPDSASSQVFVTLGRFPHLDGESAYLGEAEPGWERLVVGDRIRRVRVAD